MLAHGGEHFGLLDGVDAEVGFEVEVGVQQVGRVAGHLGDDGGHRVDDVVTAAAGGIAAAAGGGAAAAVAARGGRRPRSGLPQPVRSRTQPATWRSVGKSRSLQVVVAFELVVLAHGGEHFGLLDGVDAEVGFEVEVGLQQVGRVAGHLGDDRRHRAITSSTAAAAARRRWRGAARLARGRRRGAARCRPRVAHPAGDMAQRREVAQLQVRVAFELVVPAHGGEHLGLLDGVDAEVGFQVEIGVEQVGRVAGHLRDDRGHLRQDRRRLPLAAPPRRLGRRPGRRSGRGGTSRCVRHGGGWTAHGGR